MIPLKQLIVGTFSFGATTPYTGRILNIPGLVLFILNMILVSEVLVIVISAICFDEFGMNVT